MVRVSEDHDGLWIKAPYNKYFVAALKELPWDVRKWDKSRRSWWVCRSVAKQVRALIETYWGEEAILPTTEMEAYSVLWLLPGAPEVVVKAAYHAMSKLHHPDWGGETDIQQAINRAYEILVG